MTLLPFKDIPQALLEEVGVGLQHYFVSILGLHIDDRDYPLRLIGSGTLVRIDMKYCVLTAAHVWQAAEEFPAIGLSLTSYESWFQIHSDHIVARPLGSDFGAFGPDLALLLKAGVDAGLNIRYDSYLGHVIGAPTAIGAAGDDRLTSVMEIHDNISVEENNVAQEEFVKQWRATHDFGFIAINSVTQFDMLVGAINKAGSTDPLKVALALAAIKPALSQSAN